MLFWLTLPCTWLTKYYFSVVVSRQRISTVTLSLQLTVNSSLRSLLYFLPFLLNYSTNFKVRRLSILNHNSSLGTPELDSILILAPEILVILPRGGPPQKTPLSLLFHVYSLLQICVYCMVPYQYAHGADHRIHRSSVVALSRECVYQTVAWRWTTPAFRRHVTILKWILEE